MNSRYKRGWYGESQRHYLAAKGIKTNRYHANKYYAYSPTFVAGDMAPIAADGIGTAGAAVVPWIPVIVPVALAYGGAKWVVDRKKKRAKQGKGFFAEKPVQKFEKGIWGWRDPEDGFFHEDKAVVEKHIEMREAEKTLGNWKEEPQTAFEGLKKVDDDAVDIIQRDQALKKGFFDEDPEAKAKRLKKLRRELEEAKESVPRRERSSYKAEKLKGGMADGKDDCRYDQRQLEAGIKVEMEHTKDKKLAKEIAKDHLEEIPDYYTRLAHMEACAKRHYEGAPGMGWAGGGREMAYAARKGNGLFGPPKNEKLAKKIRITSPADFRKSMSTLKGKDGKVTTEEKRALTLARTRAAMQLRRENLKPETRKKFKEISQMELPEVR